MLHLVPALLILWLNGALADRQSSTSPVPSALFGLLPSPSSKTDSLRVLEAWLRERVSDEVLQRLGVWLETQDHPLPMRSSPGMVRAEGLPVLQGFSQAELNGPPRGVSRFRDGPPTVF